MSAIKIRAISLWNEARHLLSQRLANEALECLVGSEQLGLEPSKLTRLRALGWAQQGRIDEALNLQGESSPRDLLARIADRVKACRSTRDLTQVQLLQDLLELFTSGSPGAGDEVFSSLLRSGADPGIFNICRALALLQTQGSLAEAISLLKESLNGPSHPMAAASLATVQHDLTFDSQASSLMSRLQLVPPFSDESVRYLNFIKERGGTVSTPLYEAEINEMLRTLPPEPAEVRMIHTQHYGGTFLIRSMMETMLGTLAYTSVGGPCRLMHMKAEELEKAIFRPEYLQQIPCEHFRYSMQGKFITEQLFPRVRAVVLFRHPLDSFVGHFRFTRFTAGPIKHWQERLNNYLKAERCDLGASVYGTVAEWFRKQSAASYEYELLNSDDLPIVSLPFGNARETVDDTIVSWIRSGRVLPVRYEDLLFNPREQLGRIARFWGVKIDDKQLVRAVAQNLYYLSPSFAITRFPSIGYPREGILGRNGPGDWIHYCGPDAVASARGQIGEQLRYLGYSIPPNLA